MEDRKPVPALSLEPTKVARQNPPGTNAFKARIRQYPYRTAILISILINGQFLFECWFNVSYIGSRLFHNAAPIVLILAFLAAIVLALGAAVGVLFRHLRSDAQKLVWASMLYMAFSIIAVGPPLALPQAILKSGYRKTTERAKPLINALGLYENKYGTAPKELADLVPEFLSEVPSTGLALYPRFRYNRTPDGSRNNDDNPWALSVHFTYKSELQFHPNGIYNEKRSERVIDRVGDWVHVYKQEPSSY